MISIAVNLYKNTLHHSSALCFSKYIFKRNVYTIIQGSNLFQIPAHSSINEYSTSWDSHKSEFLDDIDFAKVGSPKNWENVKTSFVKSSRDATDRNVDALIIQYLTTKCYWNEGKDYLKYIKESGGSLNLGAIGKLMKFYYYYGLQNNTLSPEEMSYIKDTCKELIKKYKVLDGTTGECCIIALSLTDDWKEGLKLIENVKIASTPGAVAFCSLAVAAFKNNEPEIGWNLINSMPVVLRSPYDNVFTSWIYYCTSNFKSDKVALLSNLEKMFNFCGENDWKVGPSVVKLLSTVFSSQLNWKVENVHINRNGKCYGCKSELGEIYVTDQEYDELKKAFYSKVIVGKSIFIKSSPTEIKSFLKFLERNAPFDVAVDALNVAHSIPNNCKSSILVAVVQKFVAENKKIVVIGRNHMLKWSKRDLRYIQHNSSLFLTDDLSHDDPFLLLAALSGSHTKFLSRDIMRGHRFLLEDERLRTVFKRWQQKSQMSLTYLTSSGRCIIKEPPKYIPVAHKTKGWHIPFNKTDNQINPDSIELPEDWLCLQPKNKT